MDYGWKETEPVLAPPAVTKDSFQARKKHQLLRSGDKTLMRTCALDAKHPPHKKIINYVGNKSRMDRHLVLCRDSAACEWTGAGSSCQRDLWHHVTYPALSFLREPRWHAARRHADLLAVCSALEAAARLDGGRYKSSSLGRLPQSSPWFYECRIEPIRDVALSLNAQLHSQSSQIINSSARQQMHHSGGSRPSPQSLRAALASLLSLLHVL